jgi:RNA polymerase sigma-70 factor (ECF subfamily)
LRWHSENTNREYFQEYSSAMVALLSRKPHNAPATSRKVQSVLDQPVEGLHTELRDYHARCMEAIASGRSRAAFTDLFGYFAPRVKSFMLRLGTSVPEAEELMQEVMVTVWQKAHLYDAAQASVSTWIFRIARNRRIDAQRRQNRPELPADDPVLMPPEIERPDEIVIRSQTETRVREGLAGLSPEQLSLVKAAFYDGLSHSEIARAFGLPLGTVKSRIRLAFLRLRGELSERI